MSEFVSPNFLPENSGFEAQQRLVNYVDAPVYWSAFGLGEAANQEFPTVLPRQRLRAFSIDQAQRIAATLDPMYTNVTESENLPKEYNGLDVSAITIEHMFKPLSDVSQLTVSQALMGIAMHGYFSFNRDNMELFTIPFRYAKTIYRQQGVNFDRTAAAVAAQGITTNGDGSMSMLHYYDRAETIQLITKTRFFVDLVYRITDDQVPANTLIEALGDTQWMVAVALWGPADKRTG